MNPSQLQSVIMTPEREITIKVWECRHCRSQKPKIGKYPDRCWNYKCRRMDWDRPKKKLGRPREDEKRKSKPKSKSRRKR